MTPAADQSRQQPLTKWQAILAVVWRNTKRGFWETVDTLKIMVEILAFLAMLGTPGLAVMTWVAVYAEPAKDASIWPAAVAAGVFVQVVAMLAWWIGRGILRFIAKKVNKVQADAEQLLKDDWARRNI